MQINPNKAGRFESSFFYGEGVNLTPPPPSPLCALRIVETFWLVETFVSECLNFN